MAALKKRYYQKIDEEVSVANINGDYKTIIGNYEIINKTLAMAENSKIEDFIKWYVFINH